MRNQPPNVQVTTPPLTISVDDLYSGVDILEDALRTVLAR